MLERNRLTEIPPSIFSSLSNLNNLGLHENQLSNLSSHTFSGLNKLTHLWLYMNQLKHLPDGIFAGLHKMEIMFISTNQLRELQANLFLGLGLFRGLYLDNNRLTHLAPDVLIHLRRPLALLLGNKNDPDNKFRCDTSLCWLKREEEDGTVSFEYMGSYYLPECSNNVRWKEFRYSAGKVHYGTQSTSYFVHLSKSLPEVYTLWEKVTFNNMHVHLNR